MANTPNFLQRLTDGRRKPAKSSRSGLDGLKSLVDNVQDRLTGGATKKATSGKKAAGEGRRKAATRSTAAKKTAARGTAAKKGARTRAKSR